jgi:hypothetical protein
LEAAIAMKPTLHLLSLDDLSFARAVQLRTAVVC